ncbi:PAS domain S-box protein [Sneathiella sp.]|jgi:PAS domain S-box-containing protein|uniref:PAS domain S-box protein n=1 Tax=Sneathiella sp. TaxID=1964365 RepID=UPI0039E6B030
MRTLSDIEIALIDALEHASEAFVIFDKDGRLVLCNGSYREIYGYSEYQTKPGTHVSKLFELDLKNGNVLEELKDVSSEEYLSHRTNYSARHNWSFEYQLADGRWISINERNISSGGIISIQRDITKQKDIESKLQRGNAIFSAAFDADNNARSITVLATGKFLDVNKAWCEQNKIKREDVIGRTAIELKIWGENGKRDEVIQQVMANKSGGSYSTTLYRKEQGLRYYDLNWKVIVVDGVECLFLAVNDVTDGQLAELAKQESEHLFRLVFENAPVGLALYEERTHILSLANQRYKDISGLDVKPGEDVDWKSVTHPDDIAKDRHLYESFIKGKIDSYRTEKRIIHADGSIRRAQIDIVAAKKGGGSKTDQHLAMLTDITEQKDAELALAVSRDRFSDFNKSGSDWYWEMDRDMRYTYMSPVVFKSTGRHDYEYVGSGYLDFRVEDENLQQGDELLLKSFESLKSFRDIVVYRRNKLTKKKIWLKVSGTPFFGENGELMGFRGLSENITEEVELEEKLQQSQKMEAVGQLTGGIAHDFNNLLAVIQGNAELAREMLEENEQVDVEKMNAILRAAQRGAELTQSMLAFSRKQSLSPIVLQLDRQVSSLIEMINRTLGETIHIETEFEENLWPCIADSGKVENALLNLCINARDAMPFGGTIIIKLCNETIDEEDLAETGIATPGRYVSLAVCDTGNGIAPEEISRVFEPFYTTKEIGQGTGLGLSMVYGFAQQSGGHVTVDSKLGEGTIVTLYLPCKEDTGL